MDVFNPEAWKQQWAAFMSYPYILVTGIALTAGVVWWFRGFQITVCKDRLALAADKVELADRAKDNVEKQFHAYKEEVAAGGGYDALATRVANVETAIEELSTANNAVRSAIGIAVGSSSVGASSITDTISDLYLNPPLVLREEVERIKAEKERLK